MDKRRTAEEIADALRYKGVHLQLCAAHCLDMVVIAKALDQFAQEAEKKALDQAWHWFEEIYKEAAMKEGAESMRDRAGKVCRQYPASMQKECADIGARIELDILALPLLPEGEKP